LDPRNELVANIWLAGLAAMLNAWWFARVMRLRVTLATFCQGLLAGIVACTASCFCVNRLTAAAIGAVAGPLAVLGLWCCERWRIRDVTGASAFCGIGGLWGLVALGLVANGEAGTIWDGVPRSVSPEHGGVDAVRGLLFGDPSQLAPQLLAALAAVVLGALPAYFWVRATNRLFTSRSKVSEPVK
jgi:Amt family ammonium transporter